MPGRLPQHVAVKVFRALQLSFLMQAYGGIEQLDDRCLVGRMGHGRAGSSATGHWRPDCEHVAVHEDGGIAAFGFDIHTVDEHQVRGLPWHAIAVDDIVRRSVIGDLEFDNIAYSLRRQELRQRGVHLECNLHR